MVNINTNVYVNYVWGDREDSGTIAMLCIML